MEFEREHGGVEPGKHADIGGGAEYYIWKRRESYRRAGVVGGDGGGAEFFGGILVVLGLLTRIAALSILINMLVAIWKVHWHNGPTGNGGYEYPMSLAVIAFALVFFGAGSIAFDAIHGGGGGRGSSGGGRSKSKSK